MNGNGVVTVNMKLDMHCEKCASKIPKLVKKYNGVDEVSTDMASSMLTVTGRVDPSAIQARVESKTGKKVELIVPKDAESNEPEGEKEVVIEPTPLAVEVNSVPYYGCGVYNSTYSHPYREEMEYATRLFSDENPNACTVM